MSFLARCDAGVRHTVPKPIAMVLNYPSNPTADVGDSRFLRGSCRLRASRTI